MSSAPVNGFRRFRFSSSDGTDYRSVFEGEYGGHGMSEQAVADPAAVFEYTVAGDEHVSLRTLNATGGHRSGVIGPRDDHVIFWLSRGRLTLHLDEIARVVEPGAPTVASASLSYRFEAVDTLYNGVHVSDRFLRRVAADLALVLPPGPVVFEQQDDRVSALEPLRNLIREIGPSILDPAIDGRDRDLLNRRVAETVLSTFPVRRDPGRENEVERLQRAVQFVQENASSDITIDDIAALAGVKARRLQQLFRESFDTTPTSYLRSVRLDRVRAELDAAWPNEVTVGEIARTWRFTHLGRFASLYRDRFGEAPAATLRRGGSAAL